MEYSVNTNMLYAAACLIYICSGLFCAIVRWMHMCRPYGCQEDFFYPARRQAAFFFAAVSLQFPYLINPTDANVWIFIRIFGILYYPLCFSILFRRYFREEQLKRHPFNSLYFLATFVSIGVMLLLLFTGNGDLLSKYKDKLLLAMGCLSVALTFSLIKITVWIVRRIDKYHQDNYSNSDDFPYLFAKNVLYLPLIWIVAMWIICITANRWVKFGVDLSCAVWMVLFLTYILHPQKAFCETSDSPIGELEEHVVKQMEEKITSDIEYVESQKESPQDEVDEALRREVLAVILERFKEPHLQKSDLLAAFPHGKKKEANRFIMQVGYYKLVNMFRLRYAMLYKEAYPEATQEKIASESGFTSRFTYYKAKNTVTYIDPDLVCDVRL